MSDETTSDEAPEPSPPGPGGGARATLLLGLAVVAAFIVGAAGVSMLSGDDGPQDNELVVVTGPGLEDRVPATQRDPLPELTLAGFGGDDVPLVDLTSYRGTPLVVNFWASWCAPCVREMPDFQRFADEMSDRVPLLGVNVQDAPANAQAFVDELDITYDLATDPAGELYAAVGGYGMPTTLFVDAEGTIVYRHTGPLDTEELRAIVAERLDVRL
jgi:cytochrome c biogenesis protein CcmG, thiol:disulfide interchange protein DsbE